MKQLALDLDPIEYDPPNWVRNPGSFGWVCRIAARYHNRMASGAGLCSDSEYLEPAVREGVERDTREAMRKYIYQLAAAQGDSAC